MKDLDIQELLKNKEFDLDINIIHVKGMQYINEVNLSFSEHSVTLLADDDSTEFEGYSRNGGQDVGYVDIYHLKCKPQTASVYEDDGINGEHWVQLFTEEMLNSVNEVLFNIALDKEFEN